MQWLNSNQEASKEEFEHHQKELEATCNPIMSKMYQAGGAPGGAGGFPGAGAGGFPGAGAGGFPGAGGAPAGGFGGAAPSGGASSGPKVEEVD